MRGPRYGGVRCTNLAEAAILGRRSPTPPRTPTPPIAVPVCGDFSRFGQARAAEVTTGGVEVAVAVELVASALVGEEAETGGCMGGPGMLRRAGYVGVGGVAGPGLHRRMRGVRRRLSVCVVCVGLRPLCARCASALACCVRDARWRPANQICPVLSWGPARVCSSGVGSNSARD